MAPFWWPSPLLTIPYQGLFMLRSFQTRLRLCFWIGVSGTCFVATAAGAGEVLQITSDEASQSSLDSDGSQLVWATGDAVYRWDGSTVSVAVSTPAPEQVRVSGTNIVWRSHDGNDYEIFFFDGATTTQLTDNDVEDVQPDVSGSNVVWLRNVDPGYWNQVVFWDGASETLLGGNVDEHLPPRISGTTVVWAAWASEPPTTNAEEIYRWDGTTTTRLTFNDDFDTYPDIDGSTIVWTRRADNYPFPEDDWEVMLHDGTQTHQLTDNDLEDLFPVVRGSSVTWHAGPSDISGPTCHPPDCDIYVRKDGVDQRITDNAILDVVPVLSLDGVAWIGLDRGPNPGSDSEIFYYALGSMGAAPVPTLGPATTGLAILSLLATGTVAARTTRACAKFGS
jgi:hypothetical protein